MTRSTGGWVGLLPVAVLVAAFALVPVALLLAAAPGQLGGWSGVVSVLTDPLNQRAIDNSLGQGAISAALAVALGFPAGIFLGRYDWPGRRAIRSVLLVPFLLPTLVVVVGVTDLVGGRTAGAGLVPGVAALGQGVPGIVAANLTFNLPLVVLLTANAVEAAPAALEESAATLGASPARAFRDVVAPPAMIGALAGGLLTFLFSALSFAPPLLLCGPRCYTVEARIWSLDQQLSLPGDAAALAIAMVALFLLPTILYLILVRRLPLGDARALSRSRRPAGTVIGVALATETALVLAGIAAVLGAVIARSIVPGPAGALGIGWTDLFGSGTAHRLGITVGGAVANTLLFAAAAAGVVLLVTIPAVYAVVLSPKRSPRLGLLLFVPLLISPIVLAISLATFWRPVLGGEGSVWALVIASQSLLALPFALQSLGVPLGALSPSAREAAQTLGTPRFSAFLEADLPRVRAGVTAAVLFAFALGLGEFTATNLLVTPRFETLPVAIYGLESARQYAAADAGAALLLLLSLGVFVALGYGGSRGRD